MTKKLRPFENFAEFKKVTGHDIGTPFITSFKNALRDVQNRLIVSFNDNIHTVGLGTATYSYKDILDNYLFFNEKTGKFEPLGIEEQEEEPETEKVKPAKFKVGCVYLDEYGAEQTVIAKYRHPLNKKVYVVFTPKKTSLDITFKVQEDLDGNEVCCFGDLTEGGEVVIKAKNETIPF